MTITVTPLTSALGAEIGNVDLAAELDDATIGEIRTALEENLVLVFRGQRVSEDQHIAFAARFGPIKKPPVRTKHGGPPEINVVSQDRPRGEGADEWHADNTYTSTPPFGSVLHLRQLPEAGGDTMFANMYAAYEALSAPVRELCDELSATHDVSMSMRRAIERGHSDADLSEIQRQLPPVCHPVVITHPSTGRRALFVNRNSTARINELTEREGEALLRMLFEHVRNPRFQVRVQWDTSTVVFIDNLAAQHYAVPDYSTRRILHRVAIEGQPLP